MDKPSLKDRIQYWFDTTISRGPAALIAWLALVSIILILLASFIVWVIGVDAEKKLTEQIWAFLMLTLEPDAITFGHWSIRVTTLLIVFTSIFIMSALIGIITTGIDTKLSDLRKGRSRVIESDHTVILGWSPQVFPIISELVVAKKNQPKECIVILGDKDKVEMEEEIRDKAGDTGHTRVVCRSGNPIEMGDLMIANVNSSKSIIVLAPPDAESDTSVIKSILAITKNPHRRPDPYHIVAGIHDPRNLDVARTIAPEETEFILSGSLIARIMAQTCRQSGLSIVYTELMDFAGDEIYFHEVATLAGTTFGEALHKYEDSCLIGIRPYNGPPMLHPSLDTIIQTGDQVIAISEDDDTVIISSRNEIDIQAKEIVIDTSPSIGEERALLLGWNWRAPLVINELDHYVAPGSSVKVVSHLTDVPAEIDAHCAKLVNQTCTFTSGDTTDRAVLETLLLDPYDHVIILSYSGILETQMADARTLITLLHLRDIANRLGYTFSIVSEMLDIRNRNLAEVAKPDDFIVSDRLVSLLLSQISENKGLAPIFSDLFDPQGSEVYLKPVGDYLRLAREVNFYTIVESARRHGEIAIGYRLDEHAHAAEKDYGVVINPVKSEQVSFSERDKIIVIARE